MHRTMMGAELAACRLAFPPLHDYSVDSRLTVRRLTPRETRNKRARPRRPGESIKILILSRVSTSYRTTRGDRQLYETTERRGERDPDDRQHGHRTTCPRVHTDGDGRGPGHQREETGECEVEGEDQIQHDGNAVHRRGPTQGILDCPRSGKSEWPNISCSGIAALATAVSSGLGGGPWHHA